MALVKYGGGIIQMSGSIAGNTFARNRYGNYTRARTKPVNPRTQRQSAVRAAVALLTEVWLETLTRNQRENWADYAANVAMKNKLGESIYLSGFNHFIRSNAQHAVFGHAAEVVAPVVFTLPDQDPIFDVAATGAPMTIAVTFDDTRPWCSEDDAEMIVSHGLPQNASRNFFAGPWRVVSSLAGSVAAPITSPQNIGIQWNVNEGQKLWVKARIRRADARLSEEFTADCIVAA